ncbi:AfsR/SARP family transcriptional regulator [Streptomyces sp. UNOC14_S4]|uniref:AfsR/SARP family transcriptional regulator n=1 Tax=Streptomyces sp. UNOC14_S4 TaxID=2872340 RepID=UPI001E482FE6|nr:AfsR/SARP family transcriptional regulator [Streptomyces sp. UNOC14_S4]MCC3767695.1 AAA family ATPase [Streptomyces sp. UNOC14_S4]
MGYLEIRTDDDQVLDVTQPQQRALLSILLLHANRPVPKHRLTDLLWGPGPPASACGMLRTYLWRARTLFDDPSRLRTHPGGYALHVRPGELDLDDFRRLVDIGEQALADDPHTASLLLRQALGLWQEPVLGDLPPTAAMEAEAIHLMDRRRLAERSLVWAELALGRHHEIVPRLRAMAAADPLNEHAWAQLMLALYRSGRQADALRTYTRVRSLLADECGVDPGPELRRLHRRILDEDDTLAYRSGEAVDRGGGRADGPAGADTRDGPAPAPHQLPPDIPDFTGREAETARLVMLLGAAGAAPPVVLVCGQPGVGKTALAVHAAHRLCHRFPDGQLYVQLGATTDSPKGVREALGELLRSLGVAAGAVPESTDERAALLRTRLSGRRVLIVADDAADTAQARRLLPGMAGSALLLTSRMRLVAPPGATLVGLEPLSPAESSLMLERVIGRRRVAAEPEAARRVTAACAELPLALRVAGMRLAARPNWPLHTFAEIIGDRHGRLDVLEADDVGVRARLAPSCAALDPRARRAMRLLAHGELGDFASWVVTVLLGEPHADAVVGTLVDHCLLTPVGVDVTGEPRYRMPELLRLYVTSDQDGAAAADEAEVVRERLLDAWLVLARAADRGVARRWRPAVPEETRGEPDGTVAATIPGRVATRITLDASAWFAAESANLRRVVDRECAVRPGTAARLADRQFAWQRRHGLLDEAERTWQRIAECAVRLGQDATAAHARLQLACVDAARAGLCATPRSAVGGGYGPAV